MKPRSRPKQKSRSFLHRKLVGRKRQQTVYWAGMSIVALLSIAMLYAAAATTYPGLTLWQMYQNVASPSIRYVNITEGMRKEEVATRFAKTLGWNDYQRNRLINIHTLASGSTEGYYYPTTYQVQVNAKPEDVSKEILKTFDEKIGDKTLNSATNVVNVDTVMKIASIIQREAAGKQDMRIVSGIIWNRLFKGMTLDIDATLQYAKGTDTKWWPQVKSEDKRIDSPYNTYQNKGLPPSPISNPGADAINAALNPIKTRAIFYLHDGNRQIHTAETYQQHLINIDLYL